MYKDLITYQLAEGVTEAHLLKVAQQIIDEWMCKLPGFINWEIHRSKDGQYTDIVYWQDEAAAKNAEVEMANIPNASDWYACYQPGSIKGVGLHKIGGV